MKVNDINYKHKRLNTYVLPLGGSTVTLTTFKGEAAKLTLTTPVLHSREQFDFSGISV